MSKKRSIYDLPEEVFIPLVCFGVPLVLVFGPILLIMLVQFITTGKVNWV